MLTIFFFLKPVGSPALGKMDFQFLPQVTADESLPAQEEHPQRVAVAPEMDIEPVEGIVHGDILPIPDHPLHDPQDIRIRDIAFHKEVVVPSDQVTGGQHPQDPMQNILSVPLIQHHFVLLTPFRFFLTDLDQISLLPQQGQHADANVRIDKYTVTVQDFFKGIDLIPHT